MVKAWNEYHEMVLKPAFAWLGKHWKGYLIFVVVLYAVCYGGFALWWYGDKITEFFGEIKKKFTKQAEA